MVRWLANTLAVGHAIAPRHRAVASQSGFLEKMSHFTQIPPLLELSHSKMTTVRPSLRLAPREPGPAAEPAQLSDAEIFRQFSPYVARIGFRLLGREEDVDDLIQEVFVAAFRQRDQLRNPDAAKGWLATIAVRAARRQLRRRRVRQFVGLETGSPALELQDPTMSAEDSALLKRIYEILDRTDVDCRLAWTLRYIEGEKLEQVAQRCGCSLATAKRRIAVIQSHLQSEVKLG